MRHVNLSLALQLLVEKSVTTSVVFFWETCWASIPYAGVRVLAFSKILVLFPCFFRLFIELSHCPPLTQALCRIENTGTPYSLLASSILRPGHKVWV